MKTGTRKMSDLIQALSESVAQSGFLYFYPVSWAIVCSFFNTAEEIVFIFLFWRKWYIIIRTHDFLTLPSKAQCVEIIEYLTGKKLGNAEILGLLVFISQSLALSLDSLIFQTHAQEQSLFVLFLSYQQLFICLFPSIMWVMEPGHLLWALLFMQPLWPRLTDGATRVYYLGIRDVQWNYAPKGRNVITNQPLDSDM